MTGLADSSSRAFARLAGALYLLIGVSGVYAIIWVPSQLTVPGDPYGTAALIAQHRGLFATGIGADVILMLAEIALAVMLFAMFRSHGSVLAMTAMAARLVMVAVMATMLLPQAGILMLTSQEIQFAALDVDQRVELAWVLAAIHDSGVLVWQIFFTFHLWLLGVLAWRSACVPRFLAAGLVIGGSGYMISSFKDFQFPDLAVLAIITTSLLTIAALSEIGFALWLLVRGCILPAPANPRAG